MIDHLVIGILIGMASGIVALIVISALTLRRLDVAWSVEIARMHRVVAELQRAGERSERGVRQDIADTRVELEVVTRDARDESAEGTRALRDEITGGLRGVSDSLGRGLGELARLHQAQTEALTTRFTEFTDGAVATLRDHPLPARGELAQAQERQLTVVAAELQGLADALDSRLDGVQSELAACVSQIHVDSRESLASVRADAVGHAKDLRNELVDTLKAQVEQVRTTVDEKVESTLQRRLEENFTVVSERLQLVSERLAQVHQGLGEVQSFAAGLGNIQRALTNVRLGASKARPESASPGAGGPRVARRRPKGAADAGAETGEAARTTHAVRSQQ
jgi:DNA recombination protein RmuC